MQAAKTLAVSAMRVKDADDLFMPLAALNFIVLAIVQFAQHIQPLAPLGRQYGYFFFQLGPLKLAVTLVQIFFQFMLLVFQFNQRCGQLFTLAPFVALPAVK